MTAIYARQSLDVKDSLSIESQIDLCRRAAEGEVKVYQDKVAYSASCKSLTDKRAHSAETENGNFGIT